MAQKTNEKKHFRCASASVARLLFLLLFTIVSVRSSWAAFTTSNVAFSRMGGGNRALASTDSSVFLDEHTSAGTLIQLLALPPAATAAHKRWVARNSASSENLLARSIDTRAYNGMASGMLTTVSMAATNTAFRSMMLTLQRAGAPVNQNPILTLPGGAITYSENAPPTVIDGGALVTDVDSTDFDTGALTVDFSVNGTTDDRLAILNQGNGAGQIGVAGTNVTFGGIVIGTFTGGTGTTPLVVNFNASATPSAAQALARAITFSNVSDAPAALARTVRFVITDGDGGTSAAATKTINVTPVNDAPVLDLNGAVAGSGFNTTFTEMGGAVAIVDDKALAISDVDDTMLASATVTISNLQNAAQETLSATTAGTAITSFYNTTTGVLTLSGTDSVANYQQVLRTVTYDNSSPNPGTVTRNITFVVNDGTTSSAAVTSFVVVIPVNNTPVLGSIEATDLNYTEGAPATPITGTLVVSDADSPNLAGATVTIVAGFVSDEDVLSFTNANGITGTLNVAGNTLTLSGVATPANYQAALRSVTYRNSSTNPSTAARTVSFQVDDGNNGNNFSNVAARNINVISVNGTPTLNAITPNPLNLNQNAATQTVNLSGIGDGDGGLQTVSVTATSSNTSIIPDPTVTYTNPNTIGSLSFTPVTNASGMVTITVRVTDSFTPSAFVERTFVVNVNSTNLSPTISDILDTATNEDTATNAIAFTIGDAETPAANLLVTTASSDTALVPNAKIVLGGSGANRTLTITPTPNANGKTTITVKVSDGTNNTSDTFVLTVTPVNDAPIATNGSASTNEDTGVTIDLKPLVSDVETATANLTYSIVTPPTAAQGTLTSGGAIGTFVFTPASDFKGAATFTYKVTDSGDPAGTPANALDSQTKTVTITVNAVNDAPTISAVANQSTLEDTPTGAIAFTVGDTETAASALTVTATSSNTALVPIANIVLGGSGANRTATITPAANLSGSTLITLKVSDGTDSTNTSFTLQVLAVNDAPTAQNQNVGGSKNTPLPITLVAGDVDSLNITYRIVTQPAHGTLSGTAPNLTYTPAIGYIGGDVFTFKVNDGALDSNVATVSITIGGQNDAPVAVNDSAQTNENTPVDIDVLANDTDADGNALSVSAVALSPATHGTVTINANKTVKYTPAANYNGTAIFTYTVSDGSLQANATVSVQVRASNSAPVAINQNVTTQEDTAKAITLTATDADHDTLTYTLVSSPQSGTLSGTAPNLTYTPAANYFGADTFTFQVSDGRLTSSLATVTLQVLAVNDAPTAFTQSATTDEEAPVALVLGASDIDSPNLTFSIVNAPQHGTLSGTAPNLTYTPEINFNGADGFVFKVSDGMREASATVNITVRPVNDAPVAVNDVYPMTYRILKVIAANGVLANDVDVDTAAARLKARVISGPTKGTLQLNEDGSFLYTPYASVGGADRFTYAVSDSQNDSNVATVEVGSSAPRDIKAPSVLITTPRNNSTLRNALETIAGLASDAPDGSREGAVAPSGVHEVQVLLVRLSDSFSWNGQAFTATPTPLRTRLTGTTWRLNQPLPTGSNLQPGAYQIVATAIDNAGNRSRTSSFVRIGSASRVVLSSAVASADQVRLQFSGAISPFTQASQFIVTVDGILVELESVRAAGNVITLGLPAGMGAADSAITVQWHALKDADNNALPDQTITVSAR